MNDLTAVTSFSNQTYDQINVGASVSVDYSVTRDDVELLALVSGDASWLAADGQPAGLRDPVCEGVSAEALIHGVIKRRLPGPGTNIVGHQLTYAGQVSMGDQLQAHVTVVDKLPPDRLLLDCQVSRGDTVLLKGQVTVVAPTRNLTVDQREQPAVILRRNDVFGRLFSACENCPPVPCAVVHPCDADSLAGALEAAKHGLIEPVLVGPRTKIEAVAKAGGWDISAYRLVDTEHSHAAAEKAVALARNGEVQALMKGSLHTDELMGAVVSSTTGLRTGRRISHVFVMDVPTYPRMLLVTDAAVNVSPTIVDKVDIVQNAIDLAHVLGVPEPKVAILAAVETVNPDMPATIDAAMLCKMADRGQITGGLVDGPLAFDNAVSVEAARTKHINSPVAGLADILVVPNIEAGNMVAKQLQYLAGADSAGIVLGTRVPIVLTSRADSVRTRLASTAVLKLLAHSRAKASSSDSK
ncbi:MAG: bifunctional enoyl-CoA hydratase/phosphate acetyltransferase [Aquabacterium sp.]|uniref:bifunctional enoyl-CoA hydratase/phosphate acetyltransferase n=1 Tax=Aquabacterium sp. TaxID=1872578 RepID=UPI00121721C0|nr:bifunctional enoyl-CoA hydratase/phosphate acetyltransferase [Aquabacterium sp.]TAK93369.1 MAG: bifunctional enoyl-CoA hydratase/phosphate acetyltransferase [Aquabacterium sp.]